MNFFEHQDDARKKTGRLVILFGLAVAGIIVTTYLVVAMFVIGVSGGTLTQTIVGTAEWPHDPYGTGAHGPPTAWSLWDPTLLAAVGMGVLLLVSCGTLYKLAELRSGGRSVAEALGGRLLDPDLAGSSERKVLNVVEEMAIASGTPVPPVYLMHEEEGINAFAAGYSPSDAVIGVTQGAVNRLNRDELQGVMAHEFSHILNGDMRLNIRLIGLLHGILVIGLAGHIIFRAAAHSGSRRHRRSKDSNPLPLLALGLALMAVGYIGTFFGKIIKSAVSRQREYLADASAVQFTRNPNGLANALKRIGGLTRGSRMVSPAAPMASHLFFGQATASWFGGSLLATHPPLPERIRRIEPAWDGQFPSARVDAPEEEPRGRAQAVSSFAPAAAVAATAVAAGTAKGHRASGRVGTIDGRQLAYAAALIQGLAEPVQSAAHEPFAARGLVYALLINTESDSRSRQLAHLQSQDPASSRVVRDLLPHVDAMDAGERLPTLELAMPALRRLSKGQYAEFRQMIDALIRADGKTQLFEWMVQQVVARQLEAQFGRATPPRVRYYGLKQLAEECSLLLSTLAHAGQRNAQARQSAFTAGAVCLDQVGPSLALIPASECRLSRLQSALDRLNEVSPRLKPQIIDGCAAVVLADGRVTATEAELLRAVAAVLGCPMPPLDLEDDTRDGLAAATGPRSAATARARRKPG